MNLRWGIESFPCVSERSDKDLATIRSRFWVVGGSGGLGLCELFADIILQNLWVWAIPPIRVKRMNAMKVLYTDEGCSLVLFRGPGAQLLL